jgi:hypothetical protein
MENSSCAWGNALPPAEELGLAQWLNISRLILLVFDLSHVGDCRHQIDP